jgi:hypothetical protein
MDIDKILNNYLEKTGIINNVFRPKKTRIKLHTLALLPLLYSSENWTINLLSYGHLNARSSSRPS